MKKILVNEKALCQLLEALNGPPHLIRELQVTRDMPPGLIGNPIDILMADVEQHENS